MKRLITIIVFGAAGITALSAASIQVGSGLTANGSSNGLTTAYMNTTAGNSACVGAQLNPGTTCAAAALSNGSKLYSNTLFENATLANAVPASFSDGTNTYARATGLDFWATNPGSDTVVAIGLQNITNVALMLNNYWGMNGVQDVDVILNYNSSVAAGNGSNTQQVFHLTEGTGIRSAVACGAVGGCNTSGATAGIQGHATDAFENPIATTAPSTTNVFSSSYSLLPSGGPTAGQLVAGLYSATGNVNLDAMSFAVAANHISDYLVSVQIHAILTTDYGTGASSTGNTRTALSAITVTTTPEPSTVLMVLSGLGAVGYFRRRRKSA